ncbi:MAG: permease-like cell division protein FtsX [Bacteroidia bacterium]|nr:permease-like cell division protein FtsX [Bacteroidia bacterium]MDW8301735.1 permease-like cell division protein FtsX [Bacteroidia bacterium]
MTISRSEMGLNMRRMRSAFLTAVVSIGMVMFLLGGFLMIILHARAFIKVLRERIEIQVFINDDMSAEAKRELRLWIDKQPYTKSARYISKQEAAEIFTKRTGEDLSILDNNPLDASINIRLKAEYVESSKIAKIKEELSSKEGVIDVSFDERTINRINNNINKLWLISGGLTIIIVLVSLLLTFNTIKLSIYAKRFVIRSMQLIGATNNFIRKPFLVQGTLQGLIASLIASVLVMLLTYFTIHRIPELSIIQNTTDIILTLLILLAFGTALGLLGSLWAVSKYLNSNLDNLYT